MAEQEQSPKSIYDFTVKDIHGDDVPLSSYQGKVLLVVNVASKCGLTQSNYKELNILYEKYRDQGFEILAFPCNQFAWQEPGTKEEIQETACTRFKAEFPIFDKIEVNGKNAAPLYKFLKSEKGGLFVDAIKWNFTKFLVNREGNVVERYAPRTSPLQIEEKDKDPVVGLESQADMALLDLGQAIYNMEKKLGIKDGAKTATMHQTMLEIYLNFFNEDIKKLLGSS